MEQRRRRVKKSHVDGAVDESSAVQDQRFLYTTQPVKNPEANTYVAEPGLMAGRQQTNEVRNFKSMLQIKIFNFLLCLAKELRCFNNFISIPAVHCYRNE